MNPSKNPALGCICPAHIGPRRTRSPQRDHGSRGSAPDLTRCLGGRGKGERAWDRDVQSWIRDGDLDLPRCAGKVSEFSRLSSRQALLDQQTEKLREKSEKIKKIGQRKSEEFQELAAKKAQEVEAKLVEAEARRKEEEEKRIDALKEKHQRVEEVLHQTKMIPDTSEEKEAIRRKLEAAEERARSVQDKKEEKARAFNERVSAAQNRKWEFDAASQDAAQKIAERLSEAEARRIAEEEAKVEKTRAMNSRVEEAKNKRNDMASSPPLSPTKQNSSVESINAELAAAVSTKNVRGSPLAEIPALVLPFYPLAHIAAVEL